MAKTKRFQNSDTVYLNTEVLFGDDSPEVALVIGIKGVRYVWFTDQDEVMEALDEAAEVHNKTNKDDFIRWDDLDEEEKEEAEETGGMVADLTLLDVGGEMVWLHSDEWTVDDANAIDYAEQAIEEMDPDYRERLEDEYGSPSILS